MERPYSLRTRKNKQWCIQWDSRERFDIFDQFSPSLFLIDSLCEKSIEFYTIISSGRKSFGNYA